MQNEWINVNEQLPPKHTAVLCQIKYAKADKWSTYGLMTYVCGDWVHWWSDVTLDTDQYQVTHWMRLPGLPKGE